VNDDLDPDADCFKPPPGSILVHCIHCDEEYDSYRIEWRVYAGPNGPMGFWCCPIEGCDGKGFGFDIYPVDPEEGEKYGIHFIDDDEDDDEIEDDEELEPDGDSGGNDLPGRDGNSNGSPPGEDDIPF
jgi:hypothetical protein